MARNRDGTFTGASPLGVAEILSRFRSGYPSWGFVFDAHRGEWTACRVIGGKLNEITRTNPVALRCAIDSSLGRREEIPR
ncbi:hypothetical protein [Actinomadura alba]|uniref:Uncharacterized protein n=1 Tax=Actinomadura alba TaxID=406431 RepID=A0ABR7LV67_9ACTN|nr:hypothetical protein [Actinomadura alba]MBC6468737.1 hypothetical protein [Actinomadura alba]